MKYRYSVRGVLLFFCFFLVSESVPAQYRYSPNSPRVGQWRLSLTGGATALGCDLTEAGGRHYIEPFGSIDFGYVFHRNARVELALGIGGMSAEAPGRMVGNEFFSASLDTYVGASLAGGALYPFVFVRIGGLLHRSYSDTGSIRFETPNIGTFMYGAGIGIEYVHRRQIGIRLQGGSLLTLSDKLDNVIGGDKNDGLSFVSLSFSYYFSFSRYRR